MVVQSTTNVGKQSGICGALRGREGGGGGGGDKGKEEVVAALASQRSPSTIGTKGEMLFFAWNRF